MDWIEVTARSVDDAKELALDRLGVVEDELEFEVIDEAKGGLFRRSDARIRARVKPLSREKPVDRRRRRRGSERTGRSSGSRERRPSATAVADAPPDADPDTNGSGGAGSSSGSGESGGSRSGSRRRRGGRGRGGSGGSSGSGGTRSDTGRPRAADSDDNREEKKAEAEVDVETVPIEEQAAHAAEFALELVRTMGFTATVTTDIEEDDVTVRIEGDNLGVLVGPKAATLQALEEVTRAAVQRFAGGHGARIHVDVAGYRERRRTALADFARKIAEEVKEAGSPRSLEPMNASDRKVVHDTIAEVDGVSTSSEGEDPRRRVVIRPE
jgi:spoIIIJ-associated protein